MTNKKISKFENPNRILELNPKETLLKVGFKDNMNLCDIGAGTGIFTFEAAKLTKGNVYALEIAEDFINLLEQRKSEKNLNNVIIKKSMDKEIPLENDCCDLAIMVTVFHELEFKKEILNEIKRILNKDGVLLIIEFHKKQTPMGPEIEHRIAEEDVRLACEQQGFTLIDKFELGENFYGLLCNI